MALSREDKVDVQKAYGKALANKVSKVTRDKYYTVKENNARMKEGKSYLVNYKKARRGIAHPDDIPN